MKVNMNQRWSAVVCGATLLLLSLITVRFLGAQGTPRGLLSNPGPPPPPLPEFVTAEKEMKALDEVGARLMKLLADEKRPKDVWLHPLENRHEAARWLGKLHYLPAIPLLIKYVDTEGPSYDDGPTFPCSDALEMFGDAAVPAIVDAYLKADTQRREYCLHTAIALKSRPVALIYATGLAAQNPDPDFQERIKLLLNAIKPRVSR